MYVLASNLWFQKLMIQFFFNIDKIVYGLISSIYDLLITIARTSVLTQADIAQMADRVYKLLAIFMIFKVTLSLITYVVNPDDFSDKSKGLSKLGTNCIMVLLLLILTPYIFNYAYQLQSIILEDNAIAALVFGDEMTGNEKNSSVNTAGDDMAFVTMSAFYSPNLTFTDMYKCTNLKEKITSGDRTTYVFDKNCAAAMQSLIDNSDEDDKDNNTKALKNYMMGVEKNNLGMMFRVEMTLMTAKDNLHPDNDQFMMDYKFIFSTVVGVVIILLLITYCIDIAVRSIKLSFLQLLAPIPIISYIDPKSGKDGLFKKWYQMCFKTYLSLFIRILALYFAVYIISRVAAFNMVDLVDGSYQTNAFVGIFIIIGSLVFAKQLPKMLENLGIKLDGKGFTLNPIKKFTNEALGGKQILGAGALAGATGLAGAANFGSTAFNKNTWRGKNGKISAGGIVKGLGKTIGSPAGTLGGAVGTLRKGTSKVLKGESAGKVFSNSYGEARKAKTARSREIEGMRANGVTPGEVRAQKLLNHFRGQSPADKATQVESKTKALQAYYDTIKNQAMSCDGNDDSYIIDSNGNKIKTKSAKTLSKELDEVKKTQIDRTAIATNVNKTNIANEFMQNLNQGKNKDIFLQDANIDIKNFHDKQVIDTNGNEKTVTAQQQFNDAVDAAIQKAINSQYDETVEKEYDKAITNQRLAVKAKEGELEKRINALINGEVKYEDENGVEHTGTNVDSANRVIADAAENMTTLRDQVNSMGRSVDSNWVDIGSKDGDYVGLFKSSKGATAQSGAGQFQHVKDVAQYTKDKK